MKQSKKLRKDMLHSIEDLLWRESMPKRAVLLLNASEEVLSVIDWKKAFNLLYNGKARAAHGHDHHYDIQSATGTFRLPSAIVLVQYTYIPFRTAGKCTRKNVLRRDNYECQYCGVKLPTLSKIKTTIDHVFPRSRGGDGGWTNLVAACQKCNLHKGNKTPKEAGMRLRRKPQVPRNGFLHIRVLDEEMREVWSRWIS